MHRRKKALRLNGLESESAHVGDGNTSCNIRAYGAQDAAEEIAPHFECASSFLADCRRCLPNKMSHILTMFRRQQQATLLF